MNWFVSTCFVLCVLYMYCRLMLKLEEEHVKQQVAHVLRVQPDLVITEKGVSDLAIHYLQKANVSCIRRLRKSDNIRIARYHPCILPVTPTLVAMLF